jgi:c-di-GMP-binding flagellar brake protein YcgR
MQSRIKRAFQRHARHFTVQIASRGRIFQTTSEDLSLGGIQLSDCSDLPLDETVKLFVSVQDNLYDSFKLLLLTAVPVWKSDDKVGLRFCDVPGDIRESLASVTSAADYIQSREPTARAAV